MGAIDKLKNEARDAKGEVKESVGRATGNRDLEFEGKAEQLEAEARKAAERVRDKVEETVEDTEDRLR